MYQKSKQKETILLPLDSYLFLQVLGYSQRSGGKKLSEAFVGRLTRSWNSCQYKGYKKLFDGGLGGKEDNRYTSWSVKKMAQILDEHGLPYKFGEKEEVIEVYF